MDEFGDLTKPGRLYFLNSRFCVCYKKSDWRASVNEPKKEMKNPTNYFLRHFIYSKNAQAYSNLNFGDIVEGGGGGGAGVFGELCVPPEKSPGLIPPFTPLVKSYPLTRQQYFLYLRL